MDEEITDPWYLMGKKHLERDIEWMEMMDKRPLAWLILQKCILNDYWADVPSSPNNTRTWDQEMIDMVMSKLYYCWVRINLEIGDIE